MKASDRKRWQRIGRFCGILRITVINDVIFYQPISLFVIIKLNVVKINISNHIAILICDNKMAPIKKFPSNLFKSRFQ